MKNVSFIISILLLIILMSNKPALCQDKSVTAKSDSLSKVFSQITSGEHEIYTVVARPNMDKHNYSDSNLVKPKKNIRKDLRYNVYLGYGLASGGRVGTRIPISKKIVLGMSFGYYFANFISLSDAIQITSIGINYFFTSNQLWAVNILGIYARYMTLDPKDIRISPNIEFINLKESGLHLFFRAGFSFHLYNVLKKTIVINDFWPNIDIGINFNF